MVTMDTFKKICGDGPVVVSIKKEHIDRIFEAIGDDLPDMMSDWRDGFVLLWENMYFEYKSICSGWYTNLVDLLESIEKEYSDRDFTLEAAVWDTWDGFNVEFYCHGYFGGFEPVIKYDLYGTEIDPEQFTKKE